MSTDNGVIKIRVSPEPSPEELAAIVTAVAVALRTIPVAEPSPEPPASRWSRQGRLDAMRGLDRADPRSR